jgi:hypothetical protein
MSIKGRFCQMLIPVLGLGAMLVPACSAIARPPYLNAFNGLYATKRTKLDGCYTCHDTSYHDDVYRRLYETQDIVKALKAVEALDSDGDKFTNAQEIKARTLPGDPKDSPKRRSK